MALAWTTKQLEVMGNRRVVTGLLTCTGLTSGAVDSGLQYIIGGGFAYHSYTSAVPNAVVVFNRNSAGVASNGMIQVQTCTAGDDFHVYVVGE